MRGGTPEVNGPKEQEYIESRSRAAAKPPEPAPEKSTRFRPAIRQKSRERRRWTMNRIVTFAVLGILLAVVLWRTMAGTRGRDTVSYGDLTTLYIARDKVQSIKVVGDRIEATLKPPQAGKRIAYIGAMQLTPALVNSWTERGVNVEFRAATNAWLSALGALPYVAILVIMLFLFRQQQGGQKGIFTFGRSRAREITADMPRITFAEVAGVDEAKTELQEIVEFLRDPGRFQRLGGKIPRGVLMVGPPGTGKTHLARAIAGEARVPFFNISGSDFVEMFVGVGASRVRDLFERAKLRAPCIVFIDEIDAVGRHRGAGLGGGHDEREQTLNQLLVEMDGFNNQSAVILIAATNRPDVLDPALLRPGRFDRTVVIDMPDSLGREGILQIHVRDMPLARDVDLKTIARGTPGLSGADLRNLANEAALLAARRDRREVGMREFEIAKEKVMWGTERRSLVMTEEERRVTAIHEAGHALVALRLPGSDPVHKVTIVPRGRALGLTAYLPIDERHTVSQRWCATKLASLVGGRAAEEVVFGEVTNGSANDLELATGLARRMVCEWGMSGRLGAVSIGKHGEEVFIGKELVQARALSEQTLRIVDDEIRRVVESALQSARDVLLKNRVALDALSEALLAREVLDRHQIDRLVSPLLGRAGSSTVASEEVAIPVVPDVPIVLDHGAPSEPITRAQVAPDSRIPEDQQGRRRRRPQAREEQVAEPEPVVAATTSADVVEEPIEQPATVPEPAPTVSELAEPAAVKSEPEPATPPPVEFGRRPKLVKRFGLPTSQVLEAGIPVSSVVPPGEIAYGRSLRAAVRTPPPVETVVEPEQSAFLADSAPAEIGGESTPSESEDSGGPGENVEPMNLFEAAIAPEPSEDTVLEPGDVTLQADQPPTPVEGGETSEARPARRTRSRTRKIVEDDASAA